MFAFVLVQTYAYMTADVDALITVGADSIIAKDGPERRAERLVEHLLVDPNRVKVGGLFDPDGNLLAGNIAGVPAGLRVDGTPQLVSLTRIEASVRQARTVR